MLDDSGNLVTNPDLIKDLTLEVYRKRLQNRNMKKNLVHIQKEKEQLCYKRLKDAKNNKTEPWTMDDLEAVLNQLKKNKSRDPLGYANEIFST